MSEFLLFIILLPIGGIFGMVGSLIVDHTRVHMEVAGVNTRSDYSGYSEGIALECYSLYATRRNVWYRIWISLFVCGYLLIMIGVHFMLQMLILRYPSDAGWYWPAMLFAFVMGVGAFITNLRTAVSLQHKERADAAINSE